MVVPPGFSVLAALSLALAAPADATIPASTQYTSVSWDDTDGLPAAEVLSLAQDARGYLWVGTTGGLARFDGSRFVVPLEAEGFAGERIHALCLGSDGSLWVGLERRVARLHPPAVTTFSAAHGLPDGSILSLHCRPNGQVWAGGHGGVSAFRGAQWTRTPLGDSVQPTIEAITEDHRGHLWLATSDGAYEGMDDGSFAARDRAIPIRNITETRDRVLWVTDQIRGARPLLTAASGLPRRSGDALNGLRLLSDRQGIFWVGTLGRGLLRLGGAPLAQLDHFRAPHDLAGDVVRSLFEDRHGNIWVGTQLGLTRLSRALIVQAASGRARQEVARALTIDGQGTVWVGTDAGLTRHSRGTETTYGLADGLPSRVVTALHTDPEGTIWIGTDRGIAQWKYGRIMRVPLTGRAVPTRVSAITSDHDSLWICDFDKGIFRLPRQTRSYQLAPPALPHQPVSAAYTDRHGGVWFGFRSGIVARFDRGRFTYYSTSDGLAGGMVTGLLQDRRGTMWVASTQGLSEQTGPGFKALLQGQHLPGRRLMALAEDAKGHLWLGADTALARVERERLLTAVDRTSRLGGELFDRSDGLGGSIALMGYPNAVLAPTGGLWLTTSAGVVVVPPLPERRREPLAVTIDEVSVDGRVVPATATLELSSSQAQMQFSYSALALRSPETVRFRYRLDGLDADWIDNGRTRRVSYAAVPPGRYRFRVIAADGDSEAETAMAVVIPPAVHQTRWFQGLAALGAGAVLMLVWRSRIRRIRHELALVVEERTRVSREIHDTLLQSLVGTALHLDNIADALHTSEPQIALRLARTRRQLERHIDDAHQAIFDLRANGVQPDLPAALRAACLSEVEPGLDLQLRVIGDPRPCPAKLQHQLLRIVGEAVVNARRHARARHIDVELAYAPDAPVVRVQVSDDGIGFEPDRAPDGHPHFGLAIVKERAQQIRADLQVQSAAGRGTTLVLAAPLPFA